MMTEWEADAQHPDEGSIHAWLDGALDAAESAHIESHLAMCPACEARVAEARGLIAGASRVVGLLDETPAPLIRPASTPTKADTGSLWRALRVTPARASIAALLIVVVGITLTRQRVSIEPTRHSADSMRTAAAPRDHLLDSAVARRLTNEHPLRAVRPAPGIAVVTPSAAPPINSAAPADPVASNRVAAGRASLSAQRDSASAVADKSRTGIVATAGATPAALERVVVAAKAAESAASDQALIGKVGGVSMSGSPAGECYRIESATPTGTMWGSVGLPLIVAFDRTGNGARVLTANGAETDTRANWTRAGTDSLILRLRRIGYYGSMALLATGETRSGVMRSAAAAQEQSAPQVEVTARVVSCPTR